MPAQDTPTADRIVLAPEDETLTLDHPDPDQYRDEIEGSQVLEGKILRLPLFDASDPVPLEIMHIESRTIPATIGEKTEIEILDEHPPLGTYVDDFKAEYPNVVEVAERPTTEGKAELESKADLIRLCEQGAIVAMYDGGNPLFVSERFHYRLDKEEQ